MPRRVSLPGANELFRATDEDHHAAAVDPAEATEQAAPATRPAARRRKAVVPPFAEAVSPQTREKVARRRAATPAAGRDDAAPARREPAAAPAEEEPAATGRVRHDEKITVYVSSEELLALEQARLQLRAQHGLRVDRGRIVRAAVAIAMAELAEQGGDSQLVRRLDS